MLNKNSLRTARKRNCPLTGKKRKFIFRFYKFEISFYSFSCFRTLSFIIFLHYYCYLCYYHINTLDQTKYYLQSLVNNIISCPFYRYKNPIIPFAEKLQTHLSLLFSIQLYYIFWENIFNIWKMKMVVERKKLRIREWWITDMNNEWKKMNNELRICWI